MTNTTMTRPAFFTAIAQNETLPAELRDFASLQLEKIQAANAKRAAKPSKKALENAPLIEQLVGLLSHEPQTATDLTARMEGFNVPKIASLLVQARKQGLCNSIDVKVKGKGTQKGWILPTEE